MLTLESWEVDLARFALGTFKLYDKHIATCDFLYLTDANAYQKLCVRFFDTQQSIMYANTTFGRRDAALKQLLNAVGIKTDGSDSQLTPSATAATTTTNTANTDVANNMQ
jgi:predicted nucleic acid-binding Zn ribbon protein